MKIWYLVKKVALHLALYPQDLIQRMLVIVILQVVEMKYGRLHLNMRQRPDAMMGQEMANSQPDQIGEIDATQTDKTEGTTDLQIVKKCIFWNSNVFVLFPCIL